MTHKAFIALLAPADTIETIEEMTALVQQLADACGAGTGYYAMHIDCSTPLTGEQLARCGADAGRGLHRTLAPHAPDTPSGPDEETDR